MHKTSSASEADRARIATHASSELWYCWPRKHFLAKGRSAGDIKKSKSLSRDYVRSWTVAASVVGKSMAGMPAHRVFRHTWRDSTISVVWTILMTDHVIHAKTILQRGFAIDCLSNYQFTCQLLKWSIFNSVPCHPRVICQEHSFLSSLLWYPPDHERFISWFHHNISKFNHLVPSLYSRDISWHFDLVVLDQSGKGDLEQVMRIESTRADMVVITPSELSFICNQPSVLRFILLCAHLA